MRAARATIAGFGLMRMPGERSVPVVDRGGGWRGRGTLPRSRVRPAHVSFGSLPEPVHRRPSGRSRTGFGHDHRFVENSAAIAPVREQSPAPNKSPTDVSTRVAERPRLA